MNKTQPTDCVFLLRSTIYRKIVEYEQKVG